MRNYRFTSEIGCKRGTIVAESKIDIYNSCL